MWKMGVGGEEILRFIREALMINQGGMKDECLV